MYYDPTTSKFLSVDPIDRRKDTPQDAASSEANLYLYAKNNPVNVIDPSGLGPLEKIRSRRRRRGSGSVEEVKRLKGFKLTPQSVKDGGPSGPVVAGCGNVIYGVRFTIAQPAKKLIGGWVVQRVTFTFRVTDCRGRIITLRKFKSPVTYTEAWRVFENTQAMEEEGFDVFNWEGEDSEGQGGPGTKGEVIIEGVARFHDNVPNGTIADNNEWRRNNPETFAKGLYSTTKDIDPERDIGGDISKPVRHSVHIKWNCCRRICLLRRRRPCNGTWIVSWS